MPTDNYAVAKTMLDIITTIDAGKLEWAVADIRDRFEIDCDRTVRRYVAAMGTWFTDDAGRPKLFIDARKDGLFVVARGGLLASPVEADFASVLFATKLLEFTAEGPFKRNLQKVAESIKGRARGADKSLLLRMARKFYVHHVGKQKAPADRELMTRLVTGLVNERRLSIRYNEWAKAKVVEPLCLKVSKEVLYLEVRKPGQSGHFTLTVPLIREVKVLDEKFVFPDDWHPTTDNQPRFGLMPGTVIDVEVDFDRKLETYLRSREFHPTQWLERTKDGRVVLTMRTTESDELVAWIAGFGPLATVVGPKSLRERVKKHLKGALANY